ncbi:MAG: UDP-N-acetylmuramate-L-alanine ligase [Berkelbacteria bacterium GW2011_GWA2_35_9]|uniref:UDP-N-acetylmuramate--L-alanine ligase n=1 Tax=Berkelbacteria bacterium GW2011_GWA2_35_9 TaxID=1618333 RepID=A0A0G0DJA3_9BACT|nr:MAG: UDP-N-acetylmuramate-L-alanine ligase [Berkelbacteria bacterium GW2011_GWA2_35_9]
MLKNKDNKLSKFKNIYLVGIKGVGVSGLAIILKEMGKNVSGSDLEDEFVTDKELKELDIKIDVGFEKNKIISDINLVIYSTAHQGQNNPQVIQAQKMKITTWSYGEALGEISKLKKTIAIAGSHGKTTTTAMLAKILCDAGEKPSWLIGCGALKDFNFHAHWDKGEYFVVEADEYPDDLIVGKPKFLYLDAKAVAIINIDYDHPDYFKNEKIYFNAFKKLVKHMDSGSILVLGQNNKYFHKLFHSAKSQKLIVKAVKNDKVWHNLHLEKIFGKHNYFNATIASQIAHEIGIKSRVITKALKNFQGAQRRLEIKKITDKYIWIDDYAHHPNEIKASIEAVKNQYPEYRLVTLFQSHTYSRSQQFEKEFASAICNSDEILVTPIFASAREKKSNYTDEIFFSKIKQKNSTSKFIGDIKTFKQEIEKIIAENKKIILLTVGAGDIYKWGEEIKL